MLRETRVERLEPAGMGRIGAKLERSIRLRFGHAGEPDDIVCDQAESEAHQANEDQSSSVLIHFCSLV